MSGDTGQENELTAEERRAWNEVSNERIENGKLRAENAALKTQLDSITITARVGHVQRIKDLERELGWSQYASHCFGDCQFRERAEKAESACKIEHGKRVAAEAALRVFKRYGKHRGSCVQMAGKQCSCGFDDAATRAGALSKLPATTPDRSEHGADCVCADGITSACRTITPKENV